MTGYVITAIIDYESVNVYGVFSTYEEAEVALKNADIQDVNESGEVVFDIQQIAPPQDLERDFQEADITAPAVPNTDVEANSAAYADIVDLKKPYETPAHIQEAMKVIDSLNDTYNFYDHP